MFFVASNAKGLSRSASAIFLKTTCHAVFIRSPKRAMSATGRASCTDSQNS